MSFVPRPQEIYKHFKGNLYQILTVAEHSETGERLVIYQALYGDFRTYARELGMFTSRVDRAKYPDALQEFRFELQGSDRQKLECCAGRGGEEEAPKAGAERAVFQVAGKGSEKAVSKATEGDAEKATAQEAEPELDPLLLEFLDADGYEAKLNALTALHHRITQDMITTMAIASDVEVEEGELEDRYAQLKNCLLTLDKYERNRM